MSQLVQMPDFALFYKSINITADIKPDVLSIIYTDYLAGQSDEISITLEDRTGKWIRGWFPTQGDALSLSLGYVGEPLVNLGAFEIDEIEWDYEATTGAIITIKALSTGIMKAHRTLKAKAYENTTLAEIVKRIARNLNLTVTGTIAHIPIQRVTQHQERDVEFLARLASEYYHSFKIVGRQLVFTTMGSLNARKPITSLDMTQVNAIRLKEKLTTTVRKVALSGFDSQQKKVLRAEKKAKNKRPTKKQATAYNADTLKVVTRGESNEQVNARASAALAQQNDEQQVGSISLIGNPRLVAGNTLVLRDMGLFSGKYLIKSARHSLSRGQGFTTELEVRMLEFFEENNANITRNP